VKAGRGEDHTSLELEMTIAAADEGAPDSTHYIRTPTHPTHPHPHPHTGVWLVYRPVHRFINNDYHSINNDFHSINNDLSIASLLSTY
jgi:hypothetical protein